MKAWAGIALLGTLLALGTARGERGGGIGADVELAQALDEVESESARQARLASELKLLDARRSQLQDALRGRVRSLYRISRSGMTPLAAGFDAIRSHVARVRRLRALVLSDQKAYASAQARCASARADGERARQALAQAQQRLEALRSRAGIAQLTAAEPETSISAARAGEAFYGLRLSDEPVAARADFERQRGKLAAPISGEVRVLDARRPESDGPGLEFQAAAGTPVRASAAGRVAFSDRFGSYGRLVILDHGGGYYTAYAGMGEIDVRVGDDVSPYARLGSIGAGDGAQRQPSLFFEVRRGTRALPPRAWLGM